MDENQLIHEIEEQLTKEYEDWLDSLGVSTLEELEELCTHKTN
jgi:hypothetical protein